MESLITSVSPATDDFKKFPNCGNIRHTIFAHQSTLRVEVQRPCPLESMTTSSLPLEFHSRVHFFPYAEILRRDVLRKQEHRLQQHALAPVALQEDYHNDYPSRAFFHEPLTSFFIFSYFYHVHTRSLRDHSLHLVLLHDMY